MTEGNEVVMKRCTRCGNEYPATTEYFRCGSGYNGLRNPCKQCSRESDALYRAANHEKVLESNDHWYKANINRIRATEARWRDANREQERERLRHYYAENTEKVKKTAALWKQANRKKVRQSDARYRGGSLDCGKR